MSALLYKADNRITLFGQSVPVEEWNETTIAFFFKPFSLATTFKLSGQDLKAKPIELNRWNAQKAMALNIQLYHSKSMQEKVEILSHFIFMQIKSNRRDCEMIRYATDTIMHNSNTDVLLQLLKNLHLTERTFQRVFKKYVGITATEYRRICQHYFAFSHLKSGHFEKLTDVAFTNGYFDQSHYIRSFKEFTNTTPNEYLQWGLNKGK
ncbi:MAG: AraC family transcriptional regulator [Cyclobacteriaceae bacterium]|nr:AraC family transcriptional regulator [Cyclobacteriaceae bacterium]